MSKLKPILNEFGIALIIQDGDPDAQRDRCEQQIKELLRALIDETFDKDDQNANELWQKIEQL